MAVKVVRYPIIFKASGDRVVARLYDPKNDGQRINKLIDRVMAFDEQTVISELKVVMSEFTSRHRDLKASLMKHYYIISGKYDLGIDHEQITDERKLLIGSLFTMEYSLEAAAYVNPSIIEAPDQSGLKEHEKRVIVSFRAIGEGHISSVVFQQGVFTEDDQLIFEKPDNNYIELAERIYRNEYSREEFIKKLDEMNVPNDIYQQVMNRCPEKFTYGYLRRQIEDNLQKESYSDYEKKIFRSLIWLARSHYEITFSPETKLYQRVIFPVSFSESKGIEDARFVRFEEDGHITYYATYTAYNGLSIMPRLLETTDFRHFKIVPIHGEHAQNKGMALFPRKINGKYYTLARLDGVNNYVMDSEDITVWNDADLIEEPAYLWEFLQIGNNGSPLETEHGWLLVTHGVGPMRKYSLGVTLLDINDPRIVLARTKIPILKPKESERNGYVPNVVYSCGSIIHNGQLIIAFGISDESSTFARINLQEIFAELGLVG